MSPVQVPGDSFSEFVKIPDEINSSANSSKWLTAISRVQLSARFMLTFPCLFITKSVWEAYQRLQNPRPKLLKESPFENCKRHHF